MEPKRDIHGMQGALQRHRDEMVAFVEEWLQRLDELESQRSKASKGPSARPHPAGGVPKPLPDPPPNDREEKEESQQQRAMSSHNAARMDSYALATFADLQVSEAHREVSKSAVGSTGVPKKSFKSFRKVRKKVAEIMNSQLSSLAHPSLFLHPFRICGDVHCGGGRMSRAPKAVSTWRAPCCVMLYAGVPVSYPHTLESFTWNLS